MKKILALVLALMMAACASLALADEAKVFTHEEFVAAAVDDLVTIEAYVQAHQGWWQQDGVGKLTLYLQDKDGGYFVYNLSGVAEEDVEKFAEGTKVRITGYKAEFAGELEIDGAEATYEILDEEPWIAEAEDLTAVFGTDDLINHMNEKFAIKGAKVVARKLEGKDDEFPFMYSWDGSGSRDENSDLYFDVEIGGKVYTLTVESYLTGAVTEVYAAVEALKVGDIIDCEGFLYWYEGANPHITSVTVTEAAAE